MHTSPTWESIARSSRALALVVDGRGALSHRDLSVASVVLDDHLPNDPQDLGDRTDIRTGIPVGTACNAMGYALSRLGMYEQALDWLHRVDRFSPGGGDGRGPAGTFVGRFNQGWIHLHLGFEADLDGDTPAAGAHHQRAQRQFTDAIRHDEAQGPGTDWRDSAGLLIDVARAMGGDPAAGASLAGHLGRDTARPGHRPIGLLGVAHLAVVAGDCTRAVPVLDDALIALTPDPSVNALRGRILVERLAAAEHGDPTPADDARQVLVDALLRDRRREHLTRVDGYAEAIEFERRRRTIEVTERALLIDDLTGLGNRRMLEVRFEPALVELGSTAEVLSVAFLDMDHFKQVNDRSSHLVGDRVLRTLGAEIRAVVGPTDVAIRFGGDEFLLVLPGRSADEAVRLVEEIRNRFLIRVADLTDVLAPRSRSAVTRTGGVPG